MKNLKKMAKTHYRRLQNPDYIGAYDFQEGEERIVTILSVASKKVIGPDGKSDDCIVAALAGQKPMILNSTNCKAIAKLADSPFIEDWVNLSVKLHVVKVRAFGDMVDALRIRAEKFAKALPELISGSDNFKAVRAALIAKTGTMEQVKSKYNVSSQVEAELVKP